MDYTDNKSYWKFTSVVELRTLRMFWLYSPKQKLLQLEIDGILFYFLGLRYTPHTLT